MKMSVIKSVAVYNEYTPIKEINDVKEKKITILQSSFPQQSEDMLAAILYKEKATSLRQKQKLKA